ncbi:hypothetical protein Trydic_g22128 [Trypoxylus dichotomus]
MASEMFLTLPGDIKMPALGYGTWQSKDESLETALEEALEAGYRHIDTAQIYENEEIVGNVLKRWFDEGKLTREEVFITTKLSPITMYPNKVEECLKESLRKLQLEYVDLYLIHFPITIVNTGRDTYGHPSVDYLDIWKKMEDQYLAGRAKSIGLSNFSIKKIGRILRNCRVKPANNQVEMHVYLQQKALVDYCTQNDITVVAYSPLGSRGYNEFLTRMGQPTRKLPDTLNNRTVVAISKKHSKTPAQVLIRFLLQLGVAPIPKSVTPARVRENFDVFDFELDEDDMTALRALEVGNAARICDFKVFGRVAEHPNYSF